MLKNLHSNAPTMTAACLTNIALLFYTWCGSGNVRSFQSERWFASDSHCSWRWQDPAHFSSVLGHPAPDIHKPSYARRFCSPPATPNDPRFMLTCTLTFFIYSTLSSPKTYIRYFRKSLNTQINSYIAFLSLLHIKMGHRGLKKKLKAVL